MVGKTLSHYRILEKIGADGMGEVYRARGMKLYDVQGIGENEKGGPSGLAKLVEPSYRFFRLAVIFVLVFFRETFLALFFFAARERAFRFRSSSRPRFFHQFRDNTNKKGIWFLPWFSFKKVTQKVVWI